MSDRELIIQLLERVERRIRSILFCNALSLGGSLFLAAALALKLLDLWFPLRGGIVITFLLTAFAVLAGWLLWKLIHKSPLTRAAAQIDARASLHDEMKSAYWFLSNPDAPAQQSEWIDCQLHRAARQSKLIDVIHYYPRSWPRSSYLAIALLLIVALLNFIPFQRNYNWFYLKAAPGFAWTEKENALLEQIHRRLKQKSERRLSQTLERAEAAMERLEAGQIPLAAALRELLIAQNKMAEAAIDDAGIDRALADLGGILEQSQSMNEIAQALKEHDPLAAAGRMRDLAAHLDRLPPDALKSMWQSLMQAAKADLKGLQDLQQDFKQAADAIKNGEMAAFKQLLERSAHDLTNLDGSLRAREMENAAGLELRQLEAELRHRGQDETGPSAASQSGTGEKSGTPQLQSGRGGQETPEARTDGPSGREEMATRQSDSLMPSGIPHAPLPIMGEATTLEVQLNKEKVPGSADTGAKRSNLEEATGGARARLEYRSLQQELSPTHKDVLDRQAVPREYRNLVRNYFLAIRPREKQ